MPNRRKYKKYVGEDEDIQMMEDTYYHSRQNPELKEMLDKEFPYKQKAKTLDEYFKNATKSPKKNKHKPIENYHDQPIEVR